MAHTVRIQTVHRAHMITNSTNAQRVASALDEWSTHAPRFQQRWSHIDDARPAHWKSEKAVCLTFVMILEKLAS